MATELPMLHLQKYCLVDTSCKPGPGVYQTVIPDLNELILTIVSIEIDAGQES